MNRLVDLDHPRPNIPPTDSYPPFDHPERVTEIWGAAWNRRDANRLAALFEENAEFVNVTGLWWHNRASIRRAHDYGLRPIFDQSTRSPVDRRVKRLVGGPDATPATAVVHAKMELEGQTAVADVDDPRPAAPSSRSWCAGRTMAGAAPRPRTPTSCRARRRTSSTTPASSAR